MKSVIVWTPEGSESYLGAIKLPKETKSLTLEQFKLDLSSRIDRLVKEAQANGQDPLAIVEQPMWDNDRLTPPKNPADLGNLLAMDSETLHNKAAGGQDWPAKAPFNNDPTAATCLRTETLEEFLNKLYP